MLQTGESSIFLALNEMKKNSSSTDKTKNPARRKKSESGPQSAQPFVNGSTDELSGAPLPDTRELEE